MNGGGVVWACPARFLFPLLLVTETHRPGESPLPTGPGHSDSAIIGRLPLSPLSSYPPPTWLLPPPNRMPIPNTITWHQWFPQPKRPAHASSPPNLPPLCGLSSLPIHPPFLLASIWCWYPVLFTKSSGSRDVELILPRHGS